VSMLAQIASPFMAIKNDITMDSFHFIADSLTVRARCNAVQATRGNSKS